MLERYFPPSFFDIMIVRNLHKIVVFPLRRKLFAQSMQETAPKKGRGKNRFDSNKIAKAKEMGIGFNEFGQAVGDGSIVLSTFCGTLVTQLIPITYKSWPEVPEILKTSVWETTKTKFGLDDIGKDYVLSSMCNCWRQYKSKITKKVRSVPPGPEATRAIQILRPDNIVDDEEWIKFVKFRLSSEFDGISRHYSELAKKNDTPQTTSRKGMARLREELTWIAGHKHKDGMAVNENVGEKIKQMEAISLDKTTIIREDAVSQILGNEHRGRVRELGFGVTPTRVQVAVIGKQTTTQLQEEMKTLRQQVAEMKSALLTMQTNYISVVEGRLTSSSLHQVNVSDFVHSNNIFIYSQKNTCFFGRDNIQSTPAVSINEVDTSSQKGKKCKLLHWIGSGEVVAEAEIECTNPQTLVHHMILGPDHWKITVKKILVRKVPLCRPTSELHVLEDARGTYIAWPSKYITY
ncbi:hypothetical protein ACOSP7_019222 [Xanthoceras sorbifolium]